LWAAHPDTAPDQVRVLLTDLAPPVFREGSHRKRLLILRGFVDSCESKPSKYRSGGDEGDRSATTRRTSGQNSHEGTKTRKAEKSESPDVASYP